MFCIEHSQWALGSGEGGQSFCRSRRTEEREGYNMCTHVCAHTHTMWVIFVLYSGL